MHVPIAPEAMNGLGLRSMPASGGKRAYRGWQGRLGVYPKQKFKLRRYQQGSSSGRGYPGAA